VPKDLQEVIRKMAAENPTWGEEHIANELKLKRRIRVSPRTVRKYLDGSCGLTPDPSQRWLTFIHNHATLRLTDAAGEPADRRASRRRSLSIPHDRVPFIRLFGATVKQRVGELFLAPRAGLEPTTL